MQNAIGVLVEMKHQLKDVNGIHLNNCALHLRYRLAI